MAIVNGMFGTCNKGEDADEWAEGRECTGWSRPTKLYLL